MELKLPPRSLGVREFASGLRIKTSSKLLVQDTGGDIWKGSIALLAYLEAEVGHASLKEMTVLELASGTGALGLNLSLLGVHVMMTDIHTMIPLIRENVEMNAQHLESCTVGFEVLDWRVDAFPASIAEFGPYDLIIASDGTLPEHLIPARGY
jgi:methylase of polypeptide subunit release factors